MNESSQNVVTAEVKPDPADVSKNKVFAILSYFGILFILPLVCCKDSLYARFHANQGFLIFVMEIIGAVLSAILGLIPFVGAIISWIFYIVALVFAIMGIVSAVQGTTKPLPIIGAIRIIK